MSRRTDTSVRWATGLYRRATRLLPREFRTAYRDELVECFSQIAADGRRRGRAAVLSITLWSILDLMRSAPKQHLAAARAGLLDLGGVWAGSWNDVRQGVRRLLRRPSFTLTAVATLSLGLAATTAVFTLVHGVLLRPLPYPQAERVVDLDHGGSGLGIEHGLGVAHGFYRFYAARVRSLEAMAMYGWMGTTLTGAGEPERLTAVRATPSLADVLRVPPRLGRWFAGDDATPGAPPTAVLSHSLWLERFGGDPSVLGRAVYLDGVAHEVVGVMPQRFAFPAREVAVWVPLAVPESGVGGWNFQSVGRLAAGATAADVQREQAALLPLLRQATDDPERVASYLDEAVIRPRVVPLLDSVVGKLRSTLWILLGAVAFLLLVAIANVANLFLVRAEEEQQPSAVRAALGAGRVRLLRASLAESVALALAAGAVGLALAGAAVAALRRLAPIEVPRLQEVRLDPTVAGIALAACLAAALLFGLLPLLGCGRRPLAERLRDAGRHATGGRPRVRARNLLVAAQVALALVLLIAAGLMFRTFANLRAADLGFAHRQALTFEVALPEARYASRAEARQLHRRLLERIAALPGVEVAGAVAQCLPLVPSMCWGETLQAEGRPTPEGKVPPVTGARIATPDYFRALGIPLRGRPFTSADEEGGEPVAILSAAAAAAYFSGEEAIGGRITFGGEEPVWYRIVGVAGDVTARVGSHDFQRLVYLPLLSRGADGTPAQRLGYVLRTAVPPTSLVPAVRAALAELDPLVPLADVRTLNDRIDEALAPTAFALALLAVAGGLALLLGIVGLYGVVAYAVSRRSAEISVRLALGASGPAVTRMVLRQGGAVVLAGTAAGLLAAFGLTRLMESLLVGVGPTDPVSFALLTLLLLTVAAAALWIPARRAAQVSPSEALRGD